MKKLTALLFLFVTYSLALPNVINDYAETDIPQASASWMKNIITPTKDILNKADEIYANEQEDIEATIDIEKYRDLQSKNHNFLLNKKISIVDVVLDIKSTGDIANNLNIYNENINENENKTYKKGAK